MTQLTWADAKEYVEISLECNHTNQTIVRDLRDRSGEDLISTIHRVFALLAVADHPKAEAHYESMRTQYTAFQSASTWMATRRKLKEAMPLKEAI